ncbi:hypothetical protein BT63DRAFT_463564 [Microthyrium microscopicum]|uniref:Uncharacterized protein n=1 Tax=Microthyrium microscopicum TaxID=703497 RepID=A0A6A6U5R2_9PEZI|nr:hypothetical protein BT63DRAFT_463564 [Microthyrium microscopicum]
MEKKDGKVLNTRQENAFLSQLLNEVSKHKGRSPTTLVRLLFGYVLDRVFPAVENYSHWYANLEDEGLTSLIQVNIMQPNDAVDSTLKSEDDFQNTDEPEDWRILLLLLQPNPSLWEHTTGFHSVGDGFPWWFEFDKNDEVLRNLKIFHFLGIAEKTSIRFYKKTTISGPLVKFEEIFESPESLDLTKAADRYIFEEVIEYIKKFVKGIHLHDQSSYHHIIAQQLNSEVDRLIGNTEEISNEIQRHSDELVHLIQESQRLNQGIQPQNHEGPNLVQQLQEVLHNAHTRTLEVLRLYETKNQNENQIQVYNAEKERLHQEGKRKGEESGRLLEGIDELLDQIKAQQIQARKDRLDEKNGSDLDSESDD